MRNRLPFAVVSSHCHHHRHFPQPHQHQHHHHRCDHDENEVGSNTVVTEGDGAKYRGREYPWGTGGDNIYLKTSEILNDDNDDDLIIPLGQWATGGHYELYHYIYSNNDDIGIFQ